MVQPCDIRLTRFSESNDNIYRIFNDFYIRAKKKYIKQQRKLFAQYEIFNLIELEVEKHTHIHKHTHTHTHTHAHVK